MLPALAIVALVVGSVGTTLAISEKDVSAEQARTPVVEVQAVETAAPISHSSN